MNLLHLILIGAVAQTTAPPPAGLDEITASVQATAVVLRVQAQTATAPGLPLGAVEISENIDPAGDVAVCIDFGSTTPLGPLFEGETITAILSWRLSIAAAGHGVTINQAPGFAPIIEQDGRRRIQFWPLATDPDASAFEGLGVLCGVEALVMTNRGRRVPRTVLWRERQL